MSKAWFAILQLGAAATLVTASASAVNRTVSATAISTYQDFGCFEKDVGDIRLSTSLSCRNKTLYTWLPVAVDPDHDNFSARAHRYAEITSQGCWETTTAVGGYTLTNQGDVHRWNGWVEPGGTGYKWIDSGETDMPTGSLAPGSAGVAFKTWAASGCTVTWNTVEYEWFDD